MNLKSKIVSILQFLFPSSIIEWGIFLFLLIFYGILGTTIAENYRIIFDDRIPWDAYFSFDNRSIILTGGGFERHPLSNYFFDALRDIALYFSDGKKDINFRIFYAWTSNIAVSFAIVQIYKYLKNIIQLPNYQSLLLVVFTALFSTCILLSFTPETYTFTFLLLCIFHHYAAQKIKQEKVIPVLPLTLFGIGIGGLTITNIVKVFLPLLFQKKLFWNGKKIGILMLKGVFSTGIFILLFLNRLNFDYQKIFNKTGEQYEKFSNPKVTPFWDMVSSWFFGGNILFPSFILRDYHNKQGFQYKAIFMDVYSSPFSYSFVALVLFLIFWSYIKNFKKTFVQILMLSFLVDFIIHVVLKFGLHTAYIYGGHFVFVFPLLIGWLLSSYKENKVVSLAITGTLIVLTVYLGLNNFYRMSEFFNFLQQYYL
jgi:hypothetical protein